MQARQKLNFSTIMLGWRVVRDRRRLRDAEVEFAAHQKDTEAMRLPMLQRQSFSCIHTSDVDSLGGECFLLHLVARLP